MEGGEEGWQRFWDDKEQHWYWYNEESGESVWEDSVGDDDLQQQREVQSRPDHRSSAYSSEEEDDDAQSGELPACPACSQWS